MFAFACLRSSFRLFLIFWRVRRMKLHTAIRVHTPSSHYKNVSQQHLRMHLSHFYSASIALFFLLSLRLQLSDSWLPTVSHTGFGCNVFSIVAFDDNERSHSIVDRRQAFYNIALCIFCCSIIISAALNTPQYFKIIF